jgi:NADH dehydrogenase (ubiquinone) Fe-S protein 3
MTKNKLLAIKIFQIKYLAFILPKLVFRLYLRQFELDIRSSQVSYLALIFFLKMHSLTQYDVLTDLVVYDYPGKIKRFTIIYLLLSTRFNSRIRIQFQTNEILTVHTLTNLYKNAN